MFRIQHMTTDMCNLDCSYCYVRSSLGDMNQETYQEACRFVNRVLRKEMHNSIDTEIVFFGGEPLLNLKLLENIRFSPSISYSLPTNGILLNENIYDNIILKNRIRLSISYDGEFGNTYNRVLKNKKTRSGSRYDSFHFQLMRRHGCKTMLYPNMFPHLMSIYDDFKKKNIVSDFTLIRDDIYSNQDIVEYDKALTDLSNRIISDKEEYFIPGIYRLWIRKFLRWSLYRSKQLTGCFAGITGVGIKPNGKIYPCIRFSDHEISDLSSNKINHDVLEFFRNNIPSKIETCMKCKIFNICSAQCFHSSLKNGGWKRVEPIESVCQLFRISLRESLRLLKNMPTLELINI